MAADRHARLLAGDRQNRHVVEPRVIKSRDEMRGTRAGGGDANAELTRELGMRRRHERGHLLVSYLDEFNLTFGPAQRAEDAVNAVAGIAINSPDAPLVKPLHKEVTDSLGHLFSLRQEFEFAASAVCLYHCCPVQTFALAARFLVSRGAAGMGKWIEDYALIGDRRSAALVARDGSIDWLCWPHFDSDACFAARCSATPRTAAGAISPREAQHRTTRCSRGDTLTLETRYETATGTACVIDLMPIGTRHRAVIRQVTGERGSVPMAFNLALINTALGLCSSILQRGG